MQDQQRSAQSEIADVRKNAQASRGRLSSLEALQHAALGQEQGAATAWLKARGLDSAARVGEKLQVESGWENAVEGALGQLIEGVLVEAPEALVDALGDLGEGRLTLVRSGGRRLPGRADLARREGARARPRSVACSRNSTAPKRWPKRARSLPQLGDGESVITRAGERLGAGWVRVVRSGAAKQGALLREKEIQSLRAEIEDLQKREAVLNETLTRLRDQALAAEQQREDAQRALYLAHRGVSELAGQLQSQQGKLDSARNRIERIDAELSQLIATLDASREQAREARGKQEDAVGRMAELEQTRQALDAERRRFAEARDDARIAARESRDTAHALALTVESQRAQIVALAQSLERMGSQRGQLDSRLGELASQLTDGDAPVNALESERQAALEERVRVEKALAEARSALEGIDARTARQRTDAPPARRTSPRAAREDRPAQARPAGARHQGRPVVGGGGRSRLRARRTSSTRSPPDADVDAWEKAVTDFDAKLRRLEPVNLAAIQEHAEPRSARNTSTRRTPT